MRLLVTSIFIILICSCSVSNKTTNDHVVDKPIEQDTVAVAKPAMLNGKVITPSKVNTTISPALKKQ